MTNDDLQKIKDNKANEAIRARAFSRYYIYWNLQNSLRVMKKENKRVHHNDALSRIPDGNYGMLRVRGSSLIIQ